MRLQITVTVQVRDGVELPVYVGLVPASDPVSVTMDIAKPVVLAMLKASHIGNAVLRYYIGPSLLDTVTLTLNGADEQRPAAA